MKFRMLMINFIADKKERLDKFLAQQTKESRGKIQKSIKAGLVLVNKKVITEPDFYVRAGDEIEMPEIEKEVLKPSNLELKIVFENSDLAVIDKPAGLVVHPGAGHTDDTLSNALINHFPDIANVGQNMRPGIVHRLDEDTSGLLLVAKTVASYEYLKSLFEKREIEKEYIALIHGIPEKLHGIIDSPIGKTSTHKKMRTGVGRSAKTEYIVLSQTENSGLDPMSLLKVKLHTGRTHQIRVHLESIGHPIVGDSLYGGRFKLEDSKLINRQFLHAYRLKLKLQDGTWLELLSELPSELKQVLEKIHLSV